MAPIPNLIAFQKDGRILVNVGSGGGVPGLIRLNANGSADGAFSTGKGPMVITPPISIPGTGINIPGATNAGSIASVALQSSGQIIVGGNFTHFDSTTAARASMVRLKTDGSVDTTVTAGNLLAGGSGGTMVQSVAVDDSDRIYVGGRFATVNGAARGMAMIRLKADGTVDGTFADTKLTDFGNISILQIAFQPDHKILVVASWFPSVSTPTLANSAVLRLLPNGGLDPDFKQGPGFPLSTPGLKFALLANGQILGTFLPSANAAYNGTKLNGSLFRLNTDGNLDLTFPATSLILGNTALAAIHLAAIPDGRAYVSGGFNKAGNFAQSGIVRLLADGNVDTSFVTPAASFIGGLGMGVQPDGKVLVEHTYLDGANLLYSVVRLLANDPPPVSRPTLAYQVVGGNTLRVTVPAGVRLEQSASLAPASWKNIPASGSVDIPATGPAGFLRLNQP